MSRTTRLLLIFAAAVVGTIAIAFLLVTIVARQQEARLQFFRVVEIPPREPDPAVWGQNFPHQYETWQDTMRTLTFEEYSRYGRYGGSEAFQKLDVHPDYRRLFAGYPFSVDYREERGHAHALDDMLATERLGDQKPAACLSCKTPQVPILIDELGREQFYGSLAVDLVAQHDIRHSVSCADCHDAETMALVITRHAFAEAMADRGIDVTQATRQEMRMYVCGQCHVEYYFRGPNRELVFPWAQGLTVDDIEAYYDEIEFSDWVHAETGAPMIKMQHPEFELFSTSIHARAGVVCADCHMPFTRVGAVKVSSHWVNTPLSNVDTACVTCHRQSEAEMRERVLEIQDRTFGQMQHAEAALLAAMDAIVVAIEAGVPDEGLAEARHLHRRAQLRWDYISAENSMGFHSPAEAVRVLGDATDLARQAELAAVRVRLEAEQGLAGTQ